VDKVVDVALNVKRFGQEVNTHTCDVLDRTVHIMADDSGRAALLFVNPPTIVLLHLKRSMWLFQQFVYNFLLVFPPSV
jgi:hypothetical protein